MEVKGGKEGDEGEAFVICLVLGLGGWERKDKQFYSLDSFQAHHIYVNVQKNYANRFLIFQL